MSALRGTAVCVRCYKYSFRTRTTKQKHHWCLSGSEDGLLESEQQKEYSSSREKGDNTVKTFVRPYTEDNRVIEMCRNGKEAYTRKQYSPELFTIESISNTCSIVK